MPVRIGYWDRSFSKVLCYPGDAGHIVTIAPTGSGKGRDVLIPALLDEASKNISCLIIDPKGQLASVTGPQAARMGKRVIILNPFKIWPDCIGPGAERLKGLENLCDFNGSYNPMATLDPLSDSFVPDAEGLGHGIVYQQDKADHWNESARDLITGLIMWAAADGEDTQKHLSWVRSTICNRTRLFELAQKYGGDKHHAAPYEQFIQEKLGRYGEPEAEKNKELGSIISSAVSQTAFIGNGAIGKNLAGGSFRFSELRDRPTNLYLVLPGRYLKTCNRWFRLIIASALNELMEEQTERGLQVMLMMDEFAQLTGGGQGVGLRAIEDAFGSGRDYGLLMWPVIQDLTQLQRDYEKGWETICANAGALQFFRPQDNTTAEYVSKRTADFVLDRGIKTSLSEDPINPGKLSISTAPDWKEKKYLEPWEVREIGTDEFLLFAAGKNGVHRGARRSYLKTPEFQGLYSPDPYHPGQPQSEPESPPSQSANRGNPAAKPNTGGRVMGGSHNLVPVDETDEEFQQRFQREMEDD